MSITGLKPRTTPAVAALTTLIAERQTLVGKHEAILEADRRIAVAFNRELDDIAVKLRTAGFIKRVQLKSRMRRLNEQWEQARADHAANGPILADLQVQIEAIDVRLTAVNKHYQPRKTKPINAPAEARN